MVWQGSSSESSHLSFQFVLLSELRKVEVSSHLIFFPLSNLPGAAERAKKEAAEKEQELMRQKLQEQQQQMDAQKRSLEENILQLKEKMERDRETIIREQNMILEHKLKVSPAMASLVLHGLCPSTSGGMENVTARPWKKHHCHLLLVIC